MQSIGGGIGGDIDYVQSGNVITMGDNSLGIIAQSLGGNGGWVDGDFKAATGTGTAGDLTFDISGSVVTLGNGSHGALLQSIGGGDAGTIDYAEDRRHHDRRRRRDRDHRAGARRWRRLYRRQFHDCRRPGNGGAITFDLTGGIQTLATICTGRCCRASAMPPAPSITRRPETSLPAATIRSASSRRRSLAPAAMSTANSAAIGGGGTAGPIAFDLTGIDPDQRRRLARHAAADHRHHRRRHRLQPNRQRHHRGR